MTSSSFFNVVVLLLSRLDSGPSFMSISLLVSGVKTVLLISDLTRIPEVENASIWRLGQVRDTKLDMSQTPTFKKSWFYLLQWTSFKIDEKWGFFLSQKLFLFSRYHICSAFFGHLGKRLDKKVEVNIKVCNVINWQRNNYNTHIV